MKSKLLFCVCILALAWPTPSRAQEQPSLPPLLTEAGHCLVASPQDWLGLTKNPAQAGQFAWVEDGKSSPGERHVYLLARIDAGSAKLFDLRIERRHGKHLVILEKGFDLRGAPRNEVLVSPPAGGPRMVTLYQNAIVKIHHRTSYDVQLSRLRQQVPNLVCSSETGEPSR